MDESINSNHVLFDLGMSEPPRPAYLPASTALLRNLESSSSEAHHFLLQ
jgi:hypothetical protein